MAKTSVLNLSCTVSGDGLPAGQAGYIPPAMPITNIAAPGSGPQQAVLTNGDNTLAVPAGAQWVIYVPPAGSTVPKQMRASAGNVGPAMAAAKPFLWIFDAAAPANIVINTTGGETGWLFWG